MNNNNDHSDEDEELDGLLLNMEVNLTLNPSASHRIIGDYELKAKIGEGARSEVYLVSHIDHDTDRNGNDLDASSQFAMKLCKRSKLRKMKFLVSDHAGVGAMYSALDELYREIGVLRHLEHCSKGSSIVTVLHDLIEDEEEDEIALILDYLSGGTIASYEMISRSWHLNAAITKAEQRSLSDLDMLTYILQMAQESKKLILSDFGNAQVFERSDLVQDTKGTMIYWAPESIEPASFSNDTDLGWDLEDDERSPQCDQRGFSAYLLDTWALGVCIYSLYYHSFPFACYDSFSPDAEIKIMETLNLICSTEPSYKLHPNFRGGTDRSPVSAIRDIISGLLAKKPYERWSIENCVEYCNNDH